VISRNRRAIQRVEMDVEASQAASYNERAWAASSTPLVVIARSWMPGMAISFAIRRAADLYAQRLAAGDPKLVDP